MIEQATVVVWPGVADDEELLLPQAGRASTDISATAKIATGNLLDEYISLPLELVVTYSLLRDAAVFNWPFRPVAVGTC